MIYRRGNPVVVDQIFSNARFKSEANACCAVGPANHAIVAMLTTKLALVGSDPTQVLVDVATPDGALSGQSAAALREGGFRVGLLEKGGVAERPIAPVLKANRPILRNRQKTKKTPCFLGFSHFTAFCRIVPKRLKMRPSGSKYYRLTNRDGSHPFEHGGRVGSLLVRRPCGPRCP